MSVVGVSLVTDGYTFQFAEDFSRADIFITGNCCCCLLLPCVPLWCSPGWFTIPSSLVAFEMVQVTVLAVGVFSDCPLSVPPAFGSVRQAEGSSDGSFWRRNSSTCGQPFKHTYDLVEVFAPDGTPGKYHADLAEYAPDLMVISR